VPRHIFISNISSPDFQDFADIIAKGQDGAVLVSFGSIVSTKKIPPQVKTNLLTAFRRLNNVHFIIKIDKDDEVGNGKIVKLKKIFIWFLLFVGNESNGKGRE
jgi:hypothetical protein